MFMSSRRGSAAKNGLALGAKNYFPSSTKHDWRYEAAHGAARRRLAGPLTRRSVWSPGEPMTLADPAGQRHLVAPARRGR
jgi:hypothetical protein